MKEKDLLSRCQISGVVIRDQSGKLKIRLFSESRGTTIPHLRETEASGFGLVMDAKAHQVRAAGHEISLSSKEFGVLHLLFSHPDTAFTKEQIYEAVWCEPANHSYHAVENTVFQIRKKIKPYSSEHDFIKTIIGFGYKYNAE